MQSIISWALAAVLCLSAVSEAADLGKIDRTLGKEPPYQGQPKYCLLVFGPQAKTHVWLVQDGGTLYVDRNGNGDLTEACEKVVAEKRPGGRPAEDGYSFNVGAVTVSGRTHKGLTVSFSPLKRYAKQLDKTLDAKSLRALARRDQAFAVRLSVDVEMPGLRGAGLGGRVSFTAGATDLNGVLQFADKPADAPAVWLGGPLQITFYGERPVLRVGRGSEVVLVVGTQGIGPGTFAMLSYEDTIPREARPVAELSLPSAEPGTPPLKKKWVIQERC